MNVTLENVSVSFDNLPILIDINMNLEKGHIYGLIGRNGSGKTILLKTICGFIKPDKGIVKINKEDIYENHTFPKKTRAMIGNQEYLADLSGLENLQLLASIQNKIGNQEIISSLEIVNLLPEMSKKFKKYSLGMKQKLGIAQVIMENPDFMIFDEPFNGIDEASIPEIRTYFLQKKQEGKTIIIATHIKEDLDVLCDTIFELKDERLI